MKRSVFKTAAIVFVVLLALLARPPRARAQSSTDSPSADFLAHPGPGESSLALPSPGSNDLNLKILASEDSLEHPSGPPKSWLGLATDEAPEVLTSQLRLEPGVGLVVTYVATNSPAAKAGLARDDVLVAFADQALVHPQQLRKLVQVRKEGDTVKLTYYRAGKRETVSVTLAKAPPQSGWFDNNWLERRGYFQRDDIPWDQYQKDLKEHVQRLQRSLGDVRIDQKQVQEEVRRSMDQAKHAAEDAVRNASNDLKNLGPSAKALAELAKGWIGVRTDATVTVNSLGDSVQTLVKADDSGVYVIVANPRKHLTVHDSSGKLVFDGEIETPAQQAAVPKAIWEKARPLVDKMAVGKSKSTELEAPDR